jgi:hemoglobin
MKPTHFLVMSFVVLAACSFLSPSSATAQEKKEKSLYQRLGGYDAIAAVVDDFVPRLVGDPTLAKFFAGHGTESKMRIRQLVVDQICEATGGPCVYIGRTMKASHGGLAITEENWNAAVKHLGASLDKFKVPQKEKDELLGVVSTLKADIVAPAAGSDTMKK